MSASINLQLPPSIKPGTIDKLTSLIAWFPSHYAIIITSIFNNIVAVTVSTSTVFSACNLNGNITVGYAIMDHNVMVTVLKMAM